MPHRSRHRLRTERTLTLTEGRNFAVTVAPGGAAVIDLQGRSGRCRGQRSRTAWATTVCPASVPTAGNWSFSHSGRAALTHRTTGGRARALTTGPADDREPTWFPDGRRLTFTSDRNGNLDVWQLDATSGDLQPLTTLWPMTTSLP